MKSSPEKTLHIVILSVIAAIAAIIFFSWIQSDKLKNTAGMNTVFLISGICVLILAILLLLMMRYQVSSQKKNTELALNESAEKYRTLFENNLSGIYRTTAEGKIVDVNDAFGLMMGYNSAKELLGNDAHSLYFSSSDRQNFISVLQKEGQLINYEATMKHKDGRKVDIIENVSLRKDAHTGEQYIEGIVMDITQKKKTEYELFKERNLLRTLIDNLPDYIYVKDANYRHLINNKANVELIGAGSEKETLGKTVLDYFKPEIAHRFIEDDKKVIQTGEPVINREELVIADNSEQRWMLTTKIPLFDHNHSPAGLVGISRDITDQKKAEKAIQESEAKLLASIENTPNVAVQWYNNKGEVLFWNHASESMFGWASSEALGKTPDQLIHTPEEAAAFLTNLKEIEKTGHTIGPAEFTFQNRSGSKGFCISTIFSIPAIGGEPCFVSMDVDITERKNAEKEKNRLLNTIQKSLDEIYLFNSETFHFEYANDGALKNLGYTAGELYQLTPLDIKPDMTVEKVESLLRPLLNNEKEKIVFETIHKRKDNSLYPVEVHLQLIEERDRKIFLTITRDITERKKNEDKIREKNEALKTTLRELKDIIENSTDTIFKLDIAGNLIFVSPEFYRALGFAPGEMQQKHFSDIVYPEDFPACQTAFITALQTKIPQRDLIYRARTKNGQIRWSNTSASLVCNECGEPQYILGISKDITELTEASEMLEAAEERYRVFIQQSSEGIWRGEFSAPVNCSDPVDKQLQQFYEKGYLAECNDQMAKLYGLKEAKQLIGAKLSDFITINTELTQVLSHEFIKNGYRLNRSLSIQTDVNGNRKYYLNNVIGIVENGYVIRVWGMQTDITDQRLAEKKIWHLASLVDNTTDIIISHNLQLEIISWNKAAEKIFEVPASAAIGKVFKDLISVEFLNNTSREAVLQQVFEKGSCHSEILFINSAGHKIYLSVTISKWYDASGQHRGFLSVAREITDVYIAREKLEDSEQFYKSLISDSVDGTVVLDENGYITYAAPSVTNVLGFTIEEMLGKRADEFIFSGDMAAGHKIFFDEINGVSESWYHEVRYVSKDHKVIWMMMRAHNMLKNPCVKGIAVYFTDITKRKTTEIELQQSQEKLENSLEEVRRLSVHLQNIREEERVRIAREIHDELGQQLTVLKMGISWLSKKINSKEDKIQQKMNDLSGLIDNTVKTVRRISSELRPGILDDLGLVAAMEWHAKEFENRSVIQTLLHFPDDELLLPDPVRIGIFRIFQESLTNIARHSNASKVQIRLDYDRQKLLMTITDNGKGFNTESVRNKKTLGILGMRERAHMINGEYNIQSTPGKGTKIEVMVPISSTF
jgi:PAS domain S-box-containing protein